MKSKNKMHLEISERKILLRVFDVLFVLGTLHLISSFFNFTYFSFTKNNLWWIVVLSTYINLFGTIFELYNLQVASSQYAMVKSVLLTATSTVIIYLLTPILTPILPENRVQILYFFFAVFFSLLIWRFFYLKYIASNRFVKQVIFVCDSLSLDGLVHDLTSVNPHYKVAGFVSSKYEEHNFSTYEKIPFDTLEEYIYKHSISEIVIAFKSNDEITIGLYEKLLNLLENGIVIREYLQVYETSTNRIPVTYLSKDFYKYFPFSRSNQNKFYLYAVRFFEIIAAVIGMLTFFILLPLLVIINLFFNKGPLFYMQTRVGRNNAPFTIYKLRTMIVNAEQDGAVYAQTNDSRITPFGKFLRKSRLDEFPQFFNVLKGDMAIIGPRPERPEFVNEIAQSLPFYQTRHVVKPGLTGWAQVNYSYGQSLEGTLIKLQYDLFYIKHRSVFLDINILIKTLSTVLFYRGQ